MSGSYLSLHALKSAAALDIHGDDEDARLLAVLEAASRLVDRHCNRHFFELSAVRSFDGTGSSRLHLPDLIGVDPPGIRTDDDMDGVLETAWAPSEYLLLPSNADPETTGNPLSRPYTAVEANPSHRRRLPKGRKIEIAGRWGWWRHLRRAPEGLSSAVDAAAAIALSGDSGVEAGQTLLVDSEQLYVRGRSGDSLEVDRGVNGTVSGGARSGRDGLDIRVPGPGRHGHAPAGGASVARAEQDGDRRWRRSRAGGSAPAERVPQARPRRLAVAYVFTIRRKP